MELPELDAEDKAEVASMVAGMMETIARESREAHAEVAANLQTLLDLQPDKTETLRPAVARFAQLMEYTLREHDAAGKPSFHEDRPEIMLWGLEDEVIELREALHNLHRGPVSRTTVSNTLFEAVDVAISAMIVAICAGVLPTPEPIDGRGRAVLAGSSE